ncbi:Mitogen-activated protein kinase cpk1 [Irineochytrium annulatum]|nr:Mitogen-activated protein kinase cpk1 [Irineochytrium annulatum]
MLGSPALAPTSSPPPSPVIASAAGSTTPRIYGLVPSAILHQPLAGPKVYQPLPARMEGLQSMPSPKGGFHSMPSSPSLRTVPRTGSSPYASATAMAAITSSPLLLPSAWQQFQFQDEDEESERLAAVGDLAKEISNVFRMSPALRPVKSSSASVRSMKSIKAPSLRVIQPRTPESTPPLQPTASAPEDHEDDPDSHSDHHDLVTFIHPDDHLEETHEDVDNVDYSDEEDDKHHDAATDRGVKDGQKSEEHPAQPAPQLDLNQTKQAMLAVDRLKRKSYRFIKILGSGAQGSVSLRLHTPTGALVALKSIPTYLSAVDTDVRASFRREVAILNMARDHPNVIRLLDCWEARTKCYQVFDVCSGGDVDSGLPGASGPLREDRAAWLLSGITDALRHLHALGVLHRDVRPANVLLRRPVTGQETREEMRRVAVLSDFGISTLAPLSGRLALPPGSRPFHIAPEVLAGARFTWSSDCWGLGYVFARVVLGRAVEEGEWVAMMRGQGGFGGKGWGVLSREGRDALMGLLELKGKRLRAGEVLHGEWMTKWGCAFKEGQAEEMPVIDEGEEVTEGSVAAVVEETKQNN